MLPEAERNAAISDLSLEEANALLYDWPFWARPKQLPPPGDWVGWLLLAGRGFGKTRTECEWARQQAEEMPGSRGAIVAATAADARDVIVEGESGILSVCPPWNRPRYEPSKRRVTWPNGTMATLYTADEPARLRGPQHHWAVADEIAYWRYPEAWDMLMFGLRLGDKPRWVGATTPKPIKIIKDLVADSTVHVTKGTTYENMNNLAGAFFDQIIGKYEGTRLGRQELMAELLEDVPGALWKRNTLDNTRVSEYPTPFRIVTAIDPHATTGETGIVTAAVAKIDGALHGYILEDATRGGLPDEWGLATVSSFHKWNSDVLVAEINHGGDMVENVIRNIPGGKQINYKAIRASRGKYTRAEPIAAIFEQGRGHMVGFFADLEDELCSWVPGDESPNRLDAMVWALTELMLGYIDADWDNVKDLGSVKNYKNKWA